MNINAVTRLHYGLDYLPWVVKSTRGFAERHVLLFNENPSFRPGRMRPDWLETKAEMDASIFEEDRERIRWILYEPINVFTVSELYPDTDVILELDADEVISPKLLQAVRDELDAGTIMARMNRLPMVHHWRSFSYICTSQSWPPRLYFPKIDSGDTYFPGSYDRGVIHHFGYCRDRKHTEYKVELSMHAPEWRAGWWEEKYNKFPDALTDLHPCVHDLWSAEPYDKEPMREYMGDHPYFDLEVVE